MDVSIEDVQKRQTVSNSCLKTVQYRGKTYQLFTPDCYKQSFNIASYKVDPSAGSNIAFGSFLNGSASYSDLALFEKAFNIPTQNFTVNIVQNGVTYNLNDQDPATENDGEANLDVQNIVEFTPDLLSPNVSSEQNEPYLPYYEYLLAQKNKDLPYVISNSYGDHENTVPTVGCDPVTGLGIPSFRELQKLVIEACS